MSVFNWIGLPRAIQVYTEGYHDRMSYRIVNLVNHNAVCL